MNTLSLACAGVALTFLVACSDDDRAPGSRGVDSGSTIKTPRTDAGVDKEVTPRPEPDAQPPLYVLPDGAADSAPRYHPLFSNGPSSEGVDANDLCNVAPIWRPNESMDIATGLVVVFEQTLWKITGEGVSGNYTLEACTPPGTSWCTAEYQWQEVGACP